VVEVNLDCLEYPPNMGHATGLGFEDRMSWMTVGTVRLTSLCGFQTILILVIQAVRLGYLLGLERLGMQAEDVDEKLVHDRDRGKVVWSCEKTL
jgi:hypothetical protein